MLFAKRGSSVVLSTFPGLDTGRVGGPVPVRRLSSRPPGRLAGAGADSFADDRREGAQAVCRPAQGLAFGSRGSGQKYGYASTLEQFQNEIALATA
jgi:hypothetical protein